MTKVQEIICETQGEIFRCASEMGLDMDFFVPKYMDSRFCERCMDTIYSPFQMADAEECLDFIQPEIKAPQLAEVRYDPNVMEWVGYTYRHLYFALEKSSREIAERVPFLSMLAYYPGLHTVDEDMAVEIINEDKFLSTHRSDS